MRLYDETRLLNRLVDDLRELALADAGQLHLNLIPVDVAQVIRRTVDTLALAAEAQELSLSERLPDALPPVLADPDRVAEVLRNLLLNALRHTPGGGSVTVSAATGDGPWRSPLPTPVMASPPRICRMSSNDSGGRTRRGRAARRAAMVDRAARGRLCIVQSLVTAQGGRIWAESTPGVGTVFRFTLPAVG